MGSHQEFKIAGHTILFPCKPYPSQFSMMDKIIKGIERGQNCLLESPTGSGKSLALLCSTLAWQADEKRKQEEERQSEDDKSKVCQCHCHDQKPETGQHPAAAAASTTTTTSAASSTITSASDATSVKETTSPVVTKMEKVEPVDAEESIVIEDDSDEDFRPLKKFREPGKSSVSTRKKKARVSIEYEDTPPSSPSKSTSAASPSVAGPLPGTSQAPTTSTNVPPTPTSVAPCSQCSCESGAQKAPPRKVPKIFFGTRTHKQVAQIVKELRKTAYHDVAMTILASRDHTCIHPQVSHSSNKNEGCDQLMKDVGCRFKDRVMKYQSHAALKSMGLHTAWDLEDLVQLLKQKKACPYFLSRGIKDQSDLIICPYNYLVDPLIRDSMEINLKGQIVLLDEAHNIEDSVREAASQSITQEQIQRAMHDMDVLIDRGVRIADISKLRQMLHKLDKFIEDQSSSLTQHDFEQSYRMWSGFEIIAQLRCLDLGLQQCEQLKTTIVSIKASEQEERTHSAGVQDQTSMSSATWSLLEQVFLVLKYLYMDNMKYAEDYRASVVKSIQYVAANLNGSWLNSRRGKKTPVEVFTLNFWCMNPAVGFADFECCRTVILTSGTLSPMDSFQSELGLPFPIVLEANHIISNSQVWVGAVGEGPDGTSLQAVYRSMDTFSFQDSLGQLVLGVCQKVPKGVLCFFPSYKALEKLTGRWKTTGLWAKLQEHKHVMSEPRGSDKMDFEQIMRGFYNVIHAAEEREEGSGGIDGALFFAVCRGKVSEGLDFADNFARAVITVGIPYPNFKDIQVELKRKYNDRYAASRGLLSGHLWYEIQAFRALNQALGRCIRHRKDWGALIIVDDRFVKNTNKYANGLSKWVRRKLVVQRSCRAMLDSLSDFTRSRLEAQQLDDSVSTSQPPSTPLTPGSQPTTITPSPATPNPLLGIHPNSSSGRDPLHDVSNMAQSSSTNFGLPILASSSKQENPLSLSSKAFTARQNGEVVSAGVSGSTHAGSLLGKVGGHQGNAAMCSSGKQNKRTGEVVLTSVARDILNGPQKAGVEHSSVVSKSSAVPSTLSSVRQEKSSGELVTAVAEDIQAGGPAGVVASKPSVPASSQGAGVASAVSAASITGRNSGNTSGVSVVPTTLQATTPTAKALLAAGSKTAPARQLPPSGAEPVRTVSQAQGSSDIILTYIPVQGHSPRLQGPTQGNTTAPKPGIPVTTAQTANPNVQYRSLLAGPRSVTPASGGVSGTRGGTQEPWRQPRVIMAMAPGQALHPNIQCRSVLASSMSAQSVAAQQVAGGGIRPSLTASIPTSNIYTVVPAMAASQASGGSLSGSVVTSQPGTLAPAPADTTSMMFLPISDPSFKATMMVLPATSPTQTLLSLPPNISCSVGAQLVAVPASIRHVVLAHTVKQATSLFQSVTCGNSQPSGAAPAPAATIQKAGENHAGPSTTLKAVLVHNSGIGVAPQTAQKQATAPCPVSAPVAAASVSAASTSSHVSESVSSPELFGDSPEVTSVRTAPVSGSVNITSVSRSKAPAGKSQPSLKSAPRGSTSAKAQPTPSKAKDASPQVGASSAGVRLPSPTRMTTRASSSSKKANSGDVPSPQGASTVEEGRTPNTADTSGQSDPKNSSADGSVKRPRILLRKALFRNTPKKGVQDGNTVTSADVRRETTDASSDKQQETSTSATVKGEGDDAEGAMSTADEEEETVRRRVRGAKRRSLSLGARSGKKQCQDMSDVNQELTRSMKCAACGFLLLEDIKESDYERRENMPTCLKGMVTESTPEVLYFKGALVTDRFCLPASAGVECRRQQSAGVEASVQLIHCPGCKDADPLSTGSSTLLGARVTLTDTAATVSTGQMWIFTHMVTMTTTSTP